MIFCVRKALFTPDSPTLPKGLGEDLKSLGVPIEIGLPFNIDQFRTIEQWLPRLAKEIVENEVTCVSIHAPEGRVITYTTESFMKWTQSVRHLADDVGAEVIVLHPCLVNSIGRAKYLETLAANIEASRRDTSATIAIETFIGGQYFGYEEILAAGLPICLDTSHMKHSKATKVVEKNHSQITHVHLSQVKGGRPHQPVGKNGERILDKLAAKEWSGSVCMEYMDPLMAEMVRDCKRFEAKLGTL